MKDWKTLVGGILGAVSIGLTSSPDVRIHFAGMILGMAAATWFGWNAKDKDKQ